MANELDCNLEVTEFGIQSRYCVHFRTNSIEKGMNHQIPNPSYELNSIIAILLQEWLWH